MNAWSLCPSAPWNPPGIRQTRILLTILFLALQEIKYVRGRWPWPWRNLGPPHGCCSMLILIWITTQSGISQTILLSNISLEIYGFDSDKVFKTLAQVERRPSKLIVFSKNTMKSFFFYLIKLGLSCRECLKNVITIVATTYLMLAVSAKKFYILLSTVLWYKYYFEPHWEFLISRILNKAGRTASGEGLVFMWGAWCKLTYRKLPNDSVESTELPRWREGWGRCYSEKN